MRDRIVKTVEKAFIVGISVVISVLLCEYFGLSKFYAGIATLTVVNLNDARTRKQAYERTITTCCGGAVAYAIAYSGFTENLFVYIIGLTILCLITEFVLKIPATVGCIVFTYIMLNIDPKRDPEIYIRERVIATFLGALVVSLVVTVYNYWRKKDREPIEKKDKKPVAHHIKQGIIPGIAVFLGFFLVAYINNYLNSKYVTNYTLYYCALASIVTFHVDIKELLQKSKTRIVGTILGGILAFIFLFLGLESTFWLGVGVIVIILFLEIYMRVSGSLGGIVFLFIMVNMSEELTPFVYYIDRILGTLLGIILIASLSYGIGYFREYIMKK